MKNKWLVVIGGFAVLVVVFWLIVILLAKQLQQTSCPEGLLEVEHNNNVCVELDDCGRVLSISEKE